MEDANYKKAKEKALEILQEYDIKEPIVPIFDIVKEEGLQIKFFKSKNDFNDVSGFLDVKKKTIYVNEEDPPTRKLFTVAHELGHYELKHDPREYGVLLRLASIIAKDSKEKEANYFAANILVPEKFLKEKMKKYFLTKDDAFLLSRMFGVSEEMMRYRLRQI